MVSDWRISAQATDRISGVYLYRLTHTRANPHELEEFADSPTNASTASVRKMVLLR